MSWQKCPVCEGKGWCPDEILLTRHECSICKGYKIISELTGKPPAKTKTQTGYQKNNCKNPFNKTKIPGYKED